MTAELRTGTVSDAGILLTARTLRAVSWSLEVAIFAAIVGSVLAFGAVHEFSYVPLWWTAALLAALLASRSALVAMLRRRLGRQRFSFHVSGRWLVLSDEASAYELESWSCDLAAARLVRGPLAWPLTWPPLAWCVGLSPGLCSPRGSSWSCSSSRFQ